MTSWIRAAPMKIEAKKSFFFETTDAGFCSNFNQFLYAYIHSKAEGKPLQVYDFSNPVAITYPLIRNTFADISGVEFTDGMPGSTSSIRRIIQRVMSTVLSTPMDSTRAIAHRIFQWNPKLITTMQGILSTSKLPESFDLGVHIRVGDRITTRDRRLIPVDDYVTAIKKFQKSSKKDTLNIFVASDSLTAIEQLRKKADASWTIYSLSTPLPNPDGHIQSQFNRSPPRARLTAYHYFMTELLILQSISDILCTMSSNVGRFLYLTVEHPERVIGLDQKFSIV